MEILYIVVALILIVALRFAKTNKYGKKNHKSNLSNNRTFRDNKKNNSYSSGNNQEFEELKRSIYIGSNEEEYNIFRNALSSYGGGYIKYSSGTIVKKEFLGKEKGDLKGIFYNVIVPNPHIPVVKKEEFRAYLREIGVNGLDQRPDYEGRDSKLRNKAKNKDDYEKKEVGNKGEQVIRDILEELEPNWTIINGPVIKYRNEVHEYDHIAVGYNGVFVIETKAFGMTNGNATKASLFIDEGDKWFVRKNKENKEVKSPTNQITAEKNLIQNLLSSYVSEVYSIVALSNSELFVKQNIELPYKVLKPNELNNYITSQAEYINEAQRQDILTSINNCRQN